MYTHIQQFPLFETNLKSKTLSNLSPNLVWVPGQSDSPHRHPSIHTFIHIHFQLLSSSTLFILASLSVPERCSRKHHDRCCNSHSAGASFASIRVLGLTRLLSIPPFFFVLFCFVLFVFLGCRIVRSLQELVKFPVQPVLALPSFRRSFRSADRHCLVRPWLNVFGALGAWRSRSVTPRARECFGYSEIVASCLLWRSLVHSFCKCFKSFVIEWGRDWVQYLGKLGHRGVLVVKLGVFSTSNCGTVSSFLRSSWEFPEVVLSLVMESETLGDWVVRWLCRPGALSAA